MTKEDQETSRRFFELFNEIGIIEQLSRASFNARLPEGLQVPHFAVLNHLTRLGDGRTPLEIARAFQVAKPTMTYTLTKLQNEGFVSIAAHPEDGRSKQVFLTDKGRQFHQGAIASLTPDFARMMAELDTDELLAIVPALKKLRIWLDDNRP